MNAAGSLEYAHARLCARFGDRPDETLWRRIAVVRDFATVLGTVRSSALAPWITGVGPEADVHALEAAARRRWRALVNEVASWMPGQWQPGVLWCAALLDLPALREVARRGPHASWLYDDPTLGALVDPARRASETTYAALAAESAADPGRVIAAWRARWLRLLPRPLVAVPALAALVRLLDDHARRFATAHPADAWPLRRALAQRLLLAFRRAPVDPAQAFAYLALAALEYERLRGELVPRCVLPQRALAA